MRLNDAVGLLAESGVGSLGPTSWADLGCGSGTFTIALADVLAPGSAVHAMDRDRSALGKIPSRHKHVRITTHQGDFTNTSWPFGGLDGILMANSLHYVDDQASFIHACAPRMASRRFLIVEYDAEAANRWVPFPGAEGEADRSLQRGGLFDDSVPGLAGIRLSTRGAVRGARDGVRSPVSEFSLTPGCLLQSSPWTARALSH